MKNIFALTAVFAVLTCSMTQAATLRVEDQGSNIYGLYLDGEADNGNFDTVIVNVTPNAGSTFGNPSGQSADPVGSPATFINAFIGAPTAFGGLGYALLGDIVSANTLEFTAGPLGDTIDTGAGLFLANLLLDGSAVADVQLVTAGNVISRVSSPIPVPEPTSLMLVGLGLVGFVARRRS